MLVSGVGRSDLARGGGVALAGCGGLGGTGSGAVTVNAGGMLGGTGAIAGAVTVTAALMLAVYGIVGVEFAGWTSPRTRARCARCSTAGACRR